MWYAAVAAGSFRGYAAYQMATVAGVFTNTVFGLIVAFTYLALWHERPHLGGYDQAQALTFVWTGQALLAVAALRGGGLDELQERIRSGDIAAALLPDPEVLYLDEPTIGLDVVSKAKVRGFLREANAERGTTVLLTTHDLTDIEQLCRRVMVIDHGRLVYDGSLDGLRAAGGGERTLVVDLERELPPIEGVPGARTVRVAGSRQRLAFPASQSAAPLVAAVAARYPLVDLSVREPDIESLIAELYAGGGMRADAAGAGGKDGRTL